MTRVVSELTLALFPAFTTDAITSVAPEMLFSR